MNDTRREKTEASIRNACNELVYLWKRKYERCVQNNDPLPKSISIPQIADKAKVAPKTIYTNSDYKSIALTAISKTTLHEDSETLESYVDKETYTKKELQQILKSMVTSHKATLEKMSKSYIGALKKEEEYASEINNLENIIKIQATKIAETESEMSLLKGKISILTQL
jgi:putative cell wall-binding protein